MLNSNGVIKGRWECPAHTCCSPTYDERYILNETRRREIIIIAGPDEAQPADAIELYMCTGGKSNSNIFGNTAPSGSDGFG